MYQAMANKTTTMVNVRSGTRVNQFNPLIEVVELALQNV